MIRRVEADPVAWPASGALEPATTALLAIDWHGQVFQRDGAGATPNPRLAAARAATVLRRARELGFFVVHVMRHGWRSHDHLPPDLIPAEHELVTVRTSTGAFGSGALGPKLDERGVGALVLTGASADLGVHSTVREAHDRGFDSLVLQDCVTAETTVGYRVLLEMITSRPGDFGAIARSDALLRALDAPSHARTPDAAKHKRGRRPRRTSARSARPKE